MAKLSILSVILVLLASGATALAAPVDLSGYTKDAPYIFDSRAGTNTDLTLISFDYDTGVAGSALTPGFRIRRLNDDDSDSWLASVNFHVASWNVDTDFGPYSVSSPMTGAHHYEFLLNRETGLWVVAVDGVDVTDFVSIQSGSIHTTSPQPDGTDASVDGTPLPNKYFSDESDAALANAVEHYPAIYAADPTHPFFTEIGIGGTGAYRLEFAGGSATAFVDNIRIEAIPEPATMTLLGLGLVGLICAVRRRRA